LLRAGGPAIRRATVLADVAGDLPDAREEAQALAAQAPRHERGRRRRHERRVVRGRRGDLLHVAVHADIDAMGCVLADQLHAIESRRAGPAPRWSCCRRASRRCRTISSSRSLAHGFLAPARRKSGDRAGRSRTGARELISQFYQRGGRAIPFTRSGRAKPRSRTAEYRLAELCGVSAAICCTTKP